MSEHDRHAAFSILELLIVLVILLLLTGLLLPAVMSAREAARRMSCSSQIRQLAIGCHEYLSALRSFPPGASSARPVDQWYRQEISQQDFQLQGANWLMSVLPYLESTAADGWPTTSLTQIGRSAPNIARCPSDWRRRTPFVNGQEGLALAKVNYAANFGWGNYSFEAFQDHRTAGAFQLESISSITGHRSRRGRNPKSFTDGLSKTVLLSEILTLDDPRDARGAWVSAAMGASVFSARFPPNATVNDRIVHCATGQSLQTGNRMRCVPVPEDPSGSYWATARSGHPLGVLSAMADGSVRFVSDSINAAVWQQLATRAGRETIGDLGG